MAAFFALYLAALSLSIGFFCWAMYSFLKSKRPQRSKKLVVDVGPDTDPLIVALYCQYIVAPQQAMREAQQALASITVRRRTASDAGSIKDFFEVLDLLQTKSPASLR